MGNHQTNAKRQHRPSESVGFNKHDSDDERLVTIQRREQRVIEYENLARRRKMFFSFRRPPQKVHHHLKKIVS